MEIAKAEIRRVALRKFPDAQEIEIYPDLNSRGSADPGKYSVLIKLEQFAIPRQAVRQWNAEEGFHWVLKDPPMSGMVRAGRSPWDNARMKLENQRVEEGDRGLDNTVLELISDVKDDNQPTNYVVQIGPNSANRISLQVDTGSSVLWAQSRVQRSQSLPANRSILDLTIAEAARFQNGTEFYEIVYGSGKKVKFALFEGLVSIGSLKTNQAFGAAEIAKDENLLPTGILGLGFSKQDSPVPFHRTLIVQLKEAGLIKRACFALIGPRAEPAGNYRLNDRKEKDRGWLVIGNLEDRYHNGITWCRALVEEHRQWVVRLNKVTVNGVVICEDQIALMDTGSSYLATSKAHIDRIAEVIEGKVSKSGNIVYTAGALEKVAFTFGDTAEASFLLNDEDLSIGAVSNTNPSELRSPFMHLKALDSEEKKDFWILGGIFIDNMVTIFDYTGKMRIGFASKSAIDPTISDVAKL
ncbi:hypothetical protein G7Y89_g14418 [Cudoniella acicularis]|uniref:Peptidase A1 domain-containing protein n=1 Tax=Cudoniella acicularis TaxID=354080 RepID=A0A8H4R4C5_9HELO|nr:hypothetical protein G7Y89_g14418 [Cudoniella acicularis]